MMWNLQDRNVIKKTKKTTQLTTKLRRMTAAVYASGLLPPREGLNEFLKKWSLIKTGHMTCSSAHDRILKKTPPLCHVSYANVFSYKYKFCIQNVVLKYYQQNIR